MCTSQPCARASRASVPAQRNSASSGWASTESTTSAMLSPRSEGNHGIHGKRKPGDSFAHPGWMGKALPPTFLLFLIPCGPCIPWWLRFAADLLGAGLQLLQLGEQLAQGLVARQRRE